MNSDNHFENPFDQEALPDTRGTWEVQFIAQSWRQQEVEQVFQVQIVRVVYQLGYFVFLSTRCHAVSVDGTS